MTAAAPPPPCRPAQLAARAELQGSTGSLLGTVRINLWRGACTLRGRPGVSLLAGGLELDVRRVAGLPPGVTPGPARAVLRPGHDAQVALQWRNWCARVPLGLRVQLRFARTAAVEAALPPFAPRCDDPSSPSTIAVGPVQPAR